MFCESTVRVKTTDHRYGYIELVCDRAGDHAEHAVTLQPDEGTAYQIVWGTVGIKAKDGTE